MEEKSKLELLNDRLKAEIAELSDLASEYALLETELQGPVDAVAKIIGSRPKDR